MTVLRFASTTVTDPLLTPQRQIALVKVSASKHARSHFHLACVANRESTVSDQRKRGI